MRLIDADERIEEVKRSPMDSKLKDCVLDVLQRAPTVSAAPENKPLTLKELPCFEPIYVVPLGSSVGEWSAHWCIYQIDNATAKSDTHKGRMWFLYDTDYGKTWLAYARKPEGSAP